MSTLKTYLTERRNTFLPREWLDVLGAPRHVQQGELLVIAPTKKAIPDILTGVGMYERGAVTLGRGARLFAKSLPNDWRKAVDAGVINLDKPGVYGYVRGGIVNALIIEVTSDGTAVPVGKFVFDETPGVAIGYRELIVVPT